MTTKQIFDRAVIVGMEQWAWNSGHGTGIKRPCKKPSMVYR